MKVLLDTCTFIWLALDTGRLSPIATRLIEDESNELFLSDVSLWEICLKHSSGRLPLPHPPDAWIPSRRTFFSLTPLPIAEESILKTTQLPPHHTDPFDRLIAAQAISENLTILSPDKPLSLLGAARLW